MTVSQLTPNERATSATERASWPTRRHISRRARCVNTARGPISSEPSVQVLASQSGSGQDQRRLDHTSTTGRPAAGRSRTLVSRRSLGLARTPQVGQPVTEAFVSTNSHTSSSSSTAAFTTKLGMPTSTAAGSLRSPSNRGLPFLLTLTAARMTRPLTSLVHTYGGVIGVVTYPTSSRSARIAL